MKLFFISLLLIASSISHAGLADCRNLYVGRLDLYRDQGLNKFTLVEDQSHRTGSQWISVSDWDAESKKLITSIILSAKISGSMVLVETTHPSSSGACNIKSETGRTLKRLILQQGEY